MTAQIFSALNILIRPVSETSVHDTRSSQQEVLLAALKSNRELLLEQLQCEKEFEELNRWREEVMAGAACLSTGSEDTVLNFVQECLLLFLTLKRHLSLQMKLFQEAQSVSGAKPRTAAVAPPLPPDVLSVGQQKSLGAALQFVVSLGLCPYLSPGVGVPLSCRSAFGAMVEKLVHSVAVPAAERCLLTTTNVLLQMAELPSLGSLVFTQHLGDVMAALCQLGYQPRQADGCSSDGEKVEELSADERRSCRDSLRNLLGKVYQPIIIKELLILQGGPRKLCTADSSKKRPALGPAPSWLRNLCGRLLSECVMQPKGVQAVVRVILEGGTEGETDWRKCDAVAKILVTCPQQCASADAYYRQVCAQILDLLHFKDRLTALQFQRVATRAALSMVQEKPDFAQQHLLVPLFLPLHRCATTSNSDSASGKENSLAAAVEEWELTRCVEDVYKICVVGNSPSVLLLKAMEEVLLVVFTLYCFTRHNVSHLRAPCQEILLWYLSRSEESGALLMLRQISGLQEQKNQVPPDFCFTAGSEGGARLIQRESCSDEDDALFEKLSDEQWRTECLVLLLAELKDSDLPGDFFLELLHELTRWAAETDEDEQELDTMDLMLLEAEQQLLGHASRRGRRLTVLHLLAVMCEVLPHSLLLRKTTQVVDFMVSLLERASVGVEQTGPSLENPVESQTLSMGMGLVATLLSGPELSPEDYVSMSSLLPPLETLSQKHPEVFIQELASSLRAVIATHGAYRPESLMAAARSSTNSGTKPQNRPAVHSKNIQTQPSNSQIRSQRSPPNTQSRHPVAPGGSAAGPVPGGGYSDPTPKPFSDWLLEACDPAVPTRAFALRQLVQMVQDRNPEAVQAQDKVLMLFLENLQHEDSFVYLSSIQGLAVLADSYPEKILERLLEDFQHGSSLPSSNRDHSLETRLKVGEVLMRASRAMGELAPHLGRPLLGVFLRGTRDPDQSVRASSLSNLGELCQRLDYALGPLAQELSSCLTALIKMEEEAEVRRAAVHVVTLLLRGLSNKTTQVLGDILLDLYRALKWVVRSDPDDVAVLHAQLALNELDDVMKRFIFPEQKLEKKIVVLP
ncbi:transport and Golgi organization protein 6 homolog isoform X2 [Thalassophryne amazonica]|uniref:transport and Golgi organization protein 6 homolog isoform X2 n=1 Tax=Thalassophryne amazonica TaxID=390379 RepID=UPI001471E4B6|nr:transport and Golgi organization protein 6 homolog isoform X2 [Thalassophryne amazonica]